MTAPDPRVGEIEARLEPALVHAPYIRDGRRVIQANNHPSIRPYMLSDNSMPVIAEFIAHAPADVAYLLAELRKAHEALTRVECVARSLAPANADPDVTDYDRGFDDALRGVRVSIRAAVAAAKGDDRG